MIRSEELNNSFTFTYEDLLDFYIKHHKHSKFENLDWKSMVFKDLGAVAEFDVGIRSGDDDRKLDNSEKLVSIKFHVSSKNYIIMDKSDCSELCPYLTAIFCNPPNKPYEYRFLSLSPSYKKIEKEREFAAELGKLHYELTGDRFVPFKLKNAGKWL